MQIAYLNGCNAYDKILVHSRCASIVLLLLLSLCTNLSGYNLGCHRLEFNNQDSKVVFESF